MSAAPALIDNVTAVSDLIWLGMWNDQAILPIMGQPIPPMVIILLGAGLYFMLGLKGYPLRTLFPAMAGLFKKSKTPGAGEISPFAALSTALSGQVGTGNLAGVATAITLGGPGAIFWMWITALFGMALAFAEGSLAVRFRSQAEDGTYRGGPMTYITLGLGPKWIWLAVLFCLGALFSALVTGNGIQAQSLGTSAKQLFGVEPWVGGILAAIAVFLVIIGGVKSIGRVAETIVPWMAGAYLLMAMIAIILNIGDIPETFSLIFAGAFGYDAASGGFLGAMIMIAIRAGVARGLFSNEAGQGSTPIAHAVAQTNDPASQGRFAMMGTFIDTIVICTMTALVLLTVQGSFVHTLDNGTTEIVKHAWQSDLNGFDMTAGAFAAAFSPELFGVPIGTLIAATALILFVFTTMLTWSYYGERAITYLYDLVPGSSLKGEKVLHILWRLLWCIVIYFGSFADLETVWRLGDISNAAMTLPNIIALLALSGVVFALAKGNRAAGTDHGRETPKELLEEITGAPGH